MDPQTNTSILSMIGGSGPVVLGVLILLLALSVGSWAITIAKILEFTKARRQSKEFSDLFWECRDIVRIQDSSLRLQASPLSQIFKVGARELNHSAGGKSHPHNSKSAVSIDLVERALRRAELEEAHALERGITFLATVASAAPFIGLFGTVWGIMNAFHGLSFAKNSTIQAVAPGISEALVATAIGLGAAIPASVAYNYFAVEVRKFRESMDKFTEEFLSLVRERKE